MAIKNTKARNFGFLLYPDSIPNDWKEKLERVLLRSFEKNAQI
ncbi:replication protein [Lactococcus lactis]|nr:replication protein [Lactococcus lactis]UPS11457.1 hypothetical protein JRY11_002509 [Lactococcus lactis]